MAGLNYTSDQITYPKETARVGTAVRKQIPLARFYSLEAVVDQDTKFTLFGDFSDSSEEPSNNNRVLANVYIDMIETTTYYSSALSFKATVMLTAYGTAEDPKIHFVCEGRFDPVGPGDCSYRVEVEGDQHGTLRTISEAFMNNSDLFPAEFLDWESGGFEVLW